MRSYRLLLAALIAGGCAEDTLADDGFPAFWSEFRQAVAADDADAVRRLTRFPFLLDGVDHDSGAFDVIYAPLFDTAARTCLTATTPVPEDGLYLAFCGSIIYVFTREEDGWRFAEFAADPEAELEPDPGAISGTEGHPGEDSPVGDGAQSGIGAWRFHDGRPAPWAANAAAPLANAELRGTRLVLREDRLVASPPLGCADAKHEFVVSPAEGLFQGNLPEPAAESGRTLGVRRLPALTLRVRCESGVFDFHHLPGDTLLTGFDAVVWKLAPESPSGVPAGTVRALLAEHMTGEMGFTPDALGPKRSYLTATLSAGISRYFAHAGPADDEPPPINGDPFTDSQEYPDRFTLSTVSSSDSRASVRVLFSDGRRERAVVYELTRTRERWLVDDLRYEDDTKLTDLLLQQ